MEVEQGGNLVGWGSLSPEFALPRLEAVKLSEHARQLRFVCLHLALNPVQPPILQARVEISL